MWFERRKLRLLRNRRRLTQQELADKAGLLQQQISNYESGSALPRGASIALMAQALEVEMQELLK